MSKKQTDWQRLIRTTAFKLALLYTIVFILLAMVMTAYIGYQSGQLIANQTRTALEEESRILSSIYQRFGLRGLVRNIDGRARRPNANLYLVTNFRGEIIVGNVAALPPSALQKTGWQTIPYRRIELSDEPSPELLAMVRVFELPEGFTLLVGRDIEEREFIRQTVVRSLILGLLGLIILGIAAAIFIARRVLKRVDDITITASQIMQGDLSNRLVVSNRDDEFDHLSQSVNQMLGSIEHLMAGLKHVSDNIAHDLKTPLTRLRNRAEQALRRAKDQNAQKTQETQDTQDLDQILEEADNLITTFNALLLIARTEAGSAYSEFTNINLSEICADISELYAPIAEDKKFIFETNITPDLYISGKKELIAQALTNLLDNALKYGTATPGNQNRIEVKLFQDKTNICLHISDRGIGVAKQDRAKITDRFVRLDKSRSQAGSGLGLSLVKAIIDLHKAQLRFVDNNPGLRIEIDFPTHSLPSKERIRKNK